MIFFFFPSGNVVKYIQNFLNSLLLQEIFLKYFWMLRELFSVVQLFCLYFQPKQLLFLPFFSFSSFWFNFTSIFNSLSFCLPRFQSQLASESVQDLQFKANCTKKETS